MTKTELKQNWQKVLELLYENEKLDEVIVDTFFAPLTPIKMSESEGKLFLSAKQESGFYKNMVGNYQTQISDAIESIFGFSLIPVVMDSSVAEEEEKDEQQKEDYLNPKYTFPSFVPGPTNNIAYVTSRAVAEGFSKNYNPLFIYAGSGLGKTHLMHAIGHYVMQNKPKKKIIYVSAETFTSELIEAIRTRKQNQFKDKYRKTDYLLFDDVQFIAGNKTVEEELFNTFEALYNNGKQMVFTSDRPPKDLGDIPDRLTSRFVYGMMVDIQPPDYETRMAILKNKALLEMVDINEDITEVFDFIAKNIKSNIRELEGAFTRILAFSALSGKPINLELTKNVLSDIITDTKKIVTPEQIKKEIAKHFGITVDDLNSSKRAREIAYPRHIAIYITRELLNLSYPDIGRIYGGKDHTSIMHSYKVISEEIQNSKELSDEINELINKIGC